MGDLSPHFSRAEFACRCCGLDVVHPDLVASLETLRLNLRERPITVLSGYRCAEHNRAVGGKADSQHVLGRAADIRVEGVSLRDLWYAAVAVPLFNAGGVGLYVGGEFVHVDVRLGRSRWGYLPGRGYVPLADAWGEMVRREARS